MWSAVQPFYNQNKAFHVTTDDWPWTRNECRPQSCWQSQRVCYEGRKRSVKSYMRAHKKEPIMMSSNKEMVLCTPTASGWETETLFNYECLDIKDVGPKVLEIIMHKLNSILDQERACVVMSHAAYSVLTYMGGRLTPEECSSFTPDELETLEKYQMGLLKLTEKEKKDGI